MRWFDFQKYHAYVISLRKDSYRLMLCLHSSGWIARITPSAFFALPLAIRQAPRELDYGGSDKQESNKQ